MSKDGSELEALEDLARRRRAVRSFLPEPLEEGLLERLLEVARWAPSGYNLQPTHFVVVDDPRQKALLREACLGQVQVEQAPVTVVFVGDRRVAERHLEQALALDLEAGAIDAGYERMVRRTVPLAFARGPFGLGAFLKRLLPVVARPFRPVPDLPAADPRYWLAKQVMLSAMNFMLAATAAGLATVPMEGFDESRVRRVLRLPRSLVVPVVIPVGHATGEELVKTRLPLEGLVHRNRW